MVSDNLRELHHIDDCAIFSRFHQVVPIALASESNF